MRKERSEQLDLMIEAERGYAVLGWMMDRYVDHLKELTSKASPTHHPHFKKLKNTFDGLRGEASAGFMVFRRAVDPLKPYPGENVEKL